MNSDPSNNSPERPSPENLLNADIEHSLRQQFPSTRPTSEQLAGLQDAFDSLRGSSANTAKVSPQESATLVPRTKILASLAVAACLVIAVAIWSPKQWWSFDTSPAFEAVPLASLYDDAVQRGFTPYYDCSDDARFLATMRHRHNVDLQINTESDSTTKEVVKMLGVSYSGGLSRKSTVVLFVVDEVPVMVFVDNDDVRVPPTAFDKSPNPDLNTYETRRDGLVFVEVSPFGKPLATSKIQNVGD